MKYDVVIVGGGLSGLICGLHLVDNGKRCAIISSGQSAMHFSSGSFDLLGSMADGRSVTSPEEAIEEFIEQSPLHPYAKIGKENFARLAQLAASTLCRAGVPVNGTAERNHYRITPMGTLKATWLTIDGYVTAEEASKLPYSKVDIFNVAGFLDFYMQFVADEFGRMGTECRTHLFTLPELDLRRGNPTEMRSTNIARVFDKESNIEALAAIINGEIDDDCEAVMIPAAIGVEDVDALAKLRKLCRRPLYCVAAMPPSVAGICAQIALRRAFEQRGGYYLLGDNVVSAEFNDEAKVKRVFTAKHGDIGFEAEEFVLASGSFFSQGMVADKESVAEPIFAADVYYAEQRNDWYRRNMFEPQPYESFGVMTDREFHVLRRGESVENLYACGAGISHFNAIVEGSGAGVSMLTALSVAENILKK